MEESSFASEIEKITNPKAWNYYNEFDVCDDDEDYEEDDFDIHKH